MTKEICIDISSMSGFRTNYNYPLEILKLAEYDNIVNNAIASHKVMDQEENTTESYMMYIRASEYTDGVLNRSKTFTINQMSQAINFLEEVHHE